MSADTLSREDWAFLLETRARPCLSLFLPTARLGPEAAQNPVRWGEYLRRARDVMRSEGVSADDAEAALELPLELARDDDFWRHQEDGLAVYSTRGELRTYRLDLPLRLRVDAGCRFVVRPLLPWRRSDVPFYLLAVSRRRVRLLEGCRSGLRPLEVRGLPGSFDDALGFVQYDEGLPPQAAAVADAGDEIPGENLVHFFQRIATALEDALPDPRAPLVLAAVERFFPVFLATVRQPRVLAEGVVGCPDLMGDEALGRAARAVVEPWLGHCEHRALTRFRGLAGTGRTTEELERILPAAAAGRIELLLLADDAEHWGRFDPACGRVELHPQRVPGDEELGDRAAVETLRHGGEAHLVPATALPPGGCAAAVLRDLVGVAELVPRAMAVR
jgi:hypothetical protein